MSIRSFLSNLAGRDALEEDEAAAAEAAVALVGRDCAEGDAPLLLPLGTALVAEVDAACCCCSDVDVLDKVVVVVVGPGLGCATRPYLEL